MMSHVIWKDVPIPHLFCAYDSTSSYLHCIMCFVVSRSLVHNPVHWCILSLKTMLQMWAPSDKKTWETKPQILKIDDNRSPTPSTHMKLETLNQHIAISPDMSKPSGNWRNSQFRSRAKKRITSSWQVGWNGRHGIQWEQPNIELPTHFPSPEYVNAFVGHGIPPAEVARSKLLIASSSTSPPSICRPPWLPWCHQTELFHGRSMRFQTKPIL